MFTSFFGPYFGPVTPWKQSSFSSWNDQSQSFSIPAFRGCCWWSASAVRNLSYQLGMLLYLCPSADRWHFCLRSAALLRNLSCFLVPSYNTHKTLLVLFFTFLKKKALFASIALKNSPMEPVGISSVIAIILCDSQATQGHQGSLNSSKVFACKHATSQKELITYGKGTEDQLMHRIKLNIQICWSGNFYAADRSGEKGRGSVRHLFLWNMNENV